MNDLYLAHDNQDAIIGFILDKLNCNLSQLTIEENAGSLWITDKNGKTYFILIEKCEEE